MMIGGNSEVGSNSLGVQISFITSDWIAFAARDGNQSSVIRKPNFDVVSGTDVVVAEACNVNDRILKVKSGSVWREKLTPSSPGYLENVAFGINQLPNSNISSPIREYRVLPTTENNPGRLEQP
jgi:hypothetical protein